MEFLVVFLVMLAKVIFLTLILFILPIPLTWMERKVAGHIQQRLGPMRTGWHGLLQPVADGIKLMTKEDIIPDQADRLLFKLAPLLSLAPPFAVFVAIPFGEPVTIFGTQVDLYLSDMNVGLLYILGVGGLEIYGVIFGAGHLTTNTPTRQFPHLRPADQLCRSNGVCRDRGDHVGRIHESQPNRDRSGKCLEYRFTAYRVYRVLHCWISRSAAHPLRFGRGRRRSGRWLPH